MDDRRLFTVQEANDLIPFLSERLHDLGDLNHKLLECSHLVPSQQDITLKGGIPTDPEYFSHLSELQTLVEEVCEKGCYLKDLESGLVDFPTLWEGREVYLCWRLGEPEVGHWHEIEAGYAGRQSLDPDPAS